MQEPPPLSFAQKLQRTAAYIQWLCAMWTAPVEVWLRRGFGDKHFGVPALFSVIAIPLFGTWFPGTNVAPLIAFWYSYFVLLIYARVEMFRRWLRGEIEHTRYNGYSRLHRLLPHVSEVKMKSFVEPVLLLGTGAVTSGLCPALGAYLMIAGAAMAVSAKMTEVRERERLLALTDAAIEQRQLAEAFRAVYPQ